MIDAKKLVIWARELGFEQTGFCSIERFEKERVLVSQQHSLAERRQLRFFPDQDEPGCKSIAVLIWPYEPAPLCKNEIFVDSYYFASNAAYHAARELEARLLSEGHYAKANVSYPAKAAAVRAGLGWIGKNSLLHTPQFGTRVVIILMLTDIDPGDEASEMPVPSRCNGCNQCVKACPAGALDENGMGHPERCMRNFMMEGVVVPEPLRARMGMKLLGCDLCQRACPMQPKLAEGRSAPYKLENFITSDPQVFSHAAAQLAEEIGRNAARPQRIRAQAALLAGNSGNAAYLPVLKEWAKMPFEAVSEHAKWAIERLRMENSRT